MQQNPDQTKKLWILLTEFLAFGQLSDVTNIWEATERAGSTPAFASELPATKAGLNAQRGTKNSQTVAVNGGQEADPSASQLERNSSHSPNN